MDSGAGGSPRAELHQLACGGCRSANSPLAWTRRWPSMASEARISRPRRSTYREPHDDPTTCASPTRCVRTPAGRTASSPLRAALAGG
jgi:hypothetical protein